LVVGRSRRRRTRLHERICAQEIEQRRILRELAAEIDDAGLGHRTVAGAAIRVEACKFHVLLIHQLIDISPTSLPGLTRQSIPFAKILCQEDGCAGNKRVYARLRRASARA
jgi:hypothetical protein